MAGSLVWKGSRWRGVVYVDGRHKWVSLSKHLTEDQREKAQKELDALVVDARRGQLPMDGRITVAQLLEQWMDSVADDHKPTTRAQNRSRINRHILPHIGRMKVAEVKPKHIEDLFSQIKRSKRNPQGLAPQTAILVGKVLNAAFDKAVTWEYVHRNPVKIAEKPVADDPKEKRVLDADEFRGMTAALAGTKLAVPALVLGMTGIRRGEALALRWDQVDLDNGTITVEQNVTRAEGRTYLDTPKSKKGTRMIPLPSLAVDALRVYRVAQEKRKTDEVGAGWVERNLVFDDGEGNWWKPTSFSDAFARAATAAGYPGVTPHSLRHGYASIVYDATADMKMVQELLGHSTLDITMDVYTKVFDRKKREAVAKLDMVFGTSQEEKTDARPPVH